MFWSFVIVCVLAALALSGWVLAELELHGAHHELDRLQSDLDTALGWQERQLQEHAVVHTTLHLVKGRDG